MRRLGESIEDRKEYILYHKGEISGHFGVGFLVKASWKNQIKEFIGISDHVAQLNIALPGYKKDWAIIQAYAPTEKSKPSIVEQFYHVLRETLKRIENKHIIMMGDFNAQVGTRNEGEEKVLGQFGYGKRSKNGQMLVDFTLQENLTILNSLYRKKPKTKRTWKSPDGKYKNEIDYIIINYPKAFTNTEVIQNLNFNTNHRMVRSSLRLFPTKKSRVKITKYLSLNTNDRDHTPNSYILASKSSKPIPLQEKYNTLEKYIQGMPSKAKENKRRLSDETIKLIEERKEIMTKTWEDKKLKERELAAISKKNCKAIKHDRKTHRLQTLEKYIIKSGGVRKALKELREISMEWIPKMKKKGKILTKRRDISQCATDFTENSTAEKT